MSELYDIIIVGGGPAGMTAGLYLARARMKALLLEGMMCGGQILTTDVVENYPGFPHGIRGSELAGHMQKQCERFGLPVRNETVARIERAKTQGGPIGVSLEGGERLETHAVIIATGARWNQLGIPGEKELSGKGVSYCATCDGPLFKGKDVVVIGGGDTALEDALFLTKFAASVTIVHRRDTLRATKILQERARENKKIAFSFNSIAVEIKGSARVEGVIIKDVAKGIQKILKADGVFVLIGVTPNSGLAKGVVTLDENGYIITDDEMRTSANGIFACGDVRRKILRQVVTAAGEAATAAVSAQRYVEHLKGTEYK